MFNRFAQWNVLLTLREALFPVLSLALAMNVLMMLYGIVTLVQYQGVAAIRMQGIDLDYTQAAEVVRLYFFLIPIFASVSLGYILARRKQLEPVSTLLTVLVCFLRISGYLSVNPSSELVSSHSSALICLPVTWLAVHLLHTFSTKSRLRLNACSNEISPQFARSLNNIIPVLLTLLCFELLRGLLMGLVSLNPVENGLPYLPLKNSIQPIQELIIYQVIELGSWMIGLPGDQSALNIFRILYAPAIGELSLIHYQVFQYVFMSPGGSGATLAVPFIILFSKRISQFKTIAKLSLLFSLINLNEILLFGLPIAFNPLFLIPFFAAPIANMAIALFAIHLNFFQISPEPIPTMLPALYKAYLISNQSPWAVLTQLVCIVVDGCIYYPFLLAASRQLEAPIALSKWLQKGERNFIENAIEQSQELTFASKQRAMLQEAEASQRLLRRLQQGRFLLYFQPKVEARSLKLVGLEALLRFQDEKGIIRPPTFLPLLYQQGLSKAIDEKVVDMVFEQLWEWRSHRIAVPTIAINFDIAFLLDEQAVRFFLKRAKSSQVRFCIEITEHTYVTELAALASVIRKIRSAGHHISIDDFGTGYSSLTSLVSLEADEIKLDRALVVSPLAEPERSEMMLNSIIPLCHNLGFSVVAEGVETAAQLQKIQQYGADVIQGYYLGRPASAQKISETLLVSNRPKIPVR